MAIEILYSISFSCLQILRPFVSLYIHAKLLHNLNPLVETFKKLCTSLCHFTNILQTFYPLVSLQFYIYRESFLKLFELTYDTYKDLHVLYQFVSLYSYKI